MSNLENFPPSPDIPKVEGIKDPFAFQKFCIRIGAIPKNYTEALTLEEQILYFIDFLQNTVIPAVNTNADTVNSLINEFNKLYNYVNTYFENLDVQEEINNKLNQMAQSGELENIISAYLNLNCILSFNTKTEMLESEIIVEGSTCKTLGENTFNDGLGKLYKIEKIISADENEVDGIKLINIGRDDLYARLIISKANIYVFNTINDLKNTNLTNGTCLVLGYYSKGDNIPILYDIVNTGTDNGGSTIALNNGCFAVAQLNGGVTPETFGIKETDTKTESIEKWTTYMNYINSNSNLSYLLLGHTYTIYTPIIVGANFKGMGRKRTIIKAGDTISQITATVQDNQISKSCLLYYSNQNIIAQQTKTELFTLDCDNKSECGIFLSEGAYWNTENVEILNSTYAGIYIVSAWQCNWKQIAIDHTQNMGVVCGGVEEIGLTTQTFENISCQGHDTSIRGFYCTRLYYSKFVNCSIDNYNTNSARFEYCKNISGNIGCEYINSPYTFFFSNCNANLNIYATQATPSTSFINASNSNSLALNIFFWNSTINNLIELGTGQNIIDLLLDGNIANNNILSASSLSETLVLLKRSAGFYKAKNSLTFTEI